MSGGSSPGRRRVEPGTEEGWRVIDAAVRSARRHLGDGLLSAYAIGSLAHGGFSGAVSDVDLALLMGGRRDRDTTAAVAAITADVRDGGLALGDRLSIFHAPWAGFADPPRDARFPAIDRFDLVRYGILVEGTDLRGDYGVAPSAGEIRAHAVDSALARVTPERLGAELRRLAGDGVRVHDATKLVLWPVRLQHVCDTGTATGNGDAVAHYLGLPDPRHRPLVSDSLAWRGLEVIPDPGTALHRITHEIHDLYAEVLSRVSRRAGIPRRDALAQSARRIAPG